MQPEETVDGRLTKQMLQAEGSLLARIVASTSSVLSQSVTTLQLGICCITFYELIFGRLLWNSCP